jgi:hypothetical protein
MSGDPTTADENALGTGSVIDLWSGMIKCSTDCGACASAGKFKLKGSVRNATAMSSSQTLRASDKKLLDMTPPPLLLSGLPRCYPASATLIVIAQLPV